MLATFALIALFAPLTVTPSLAESASPSVTAMPRLTAMPLERAASPAAFAQMAAEQPLLSQAVVSQESSSSNVNDLDDDVEASLPEAPSAQVGARQSQAAQDSNQLGSPKAGPVAPRYTKFIPAGWTVQTLTARDKVVLGLRNLYSPWNFGSMIVAAGYEQLLNGQPNYGTDRGAYGERLGAAGLRETTQNLFTDSVFAPLLHEDPRYYVEGGQYGLIHRTLYAVTRPLITLDDSGHHTINGALLLGYAASSAMTYAYYPQINQTPRDTAATFGGGIGGAALGYFLREFSSDMLQAVHLAKKQ